MRYTIDKDLGQFGEPHENWSGYDYAYVGNDIVGRKNEECQSKNLGYYWKKAIRFRDGTTVAVPSHLVRRKKI